MPQTVLIIDDDPDEILFLSTVLKDHGYDSIGASDGLEGLEKAKLDRPDLILLDLMMPHKSGIAMLTDLKNDDNLKNIPVIMVTGVSGETGIDLDSFFQRGSQDGKNSETLKPQGFIEKPVNPQKLMGLIKKILK